MIDFRCRIGKIELTHRRSRYDVNMAVRNFETCHDQSHTTRSEDFALGFSDSFGDQDEMGGFLISQIQPVIHLSNGYDECVAR